MSEVRLRSVEPGDLLIFYEQQLDADAARMAAFPSRDRAAFDAHWATNILGNPATDTAAHRRRSSALSVQNGTGDTP